MLPSSVSYDETFKAICEVLQPYLDENWALVKRVLVLRVDELSEELLNHMAYRFHVDFYDDALPIEKKRILVKNSILYHRHKGTPWAVENLLSEMFNETWLKEWYEYGGDPYYFRIYTKDRIKDQATYDQFMSALWSVKNTRSWLDRFVVNRDVSVTIHTGAVNRELKKVTYYPYVLEDIVSNIGLFTGATNVVVKKHIYGFALPGDIEVNGSVFSGVGRSLYKRRVYLFDDSLSEFIGIPDWASSRWSDLERYSWSDLELYSWGELEVRFFGEK